MDPMKCEVQLSSKLIAAAGSTIRELSYGSRIQDCGLCKTIVVRAIICECCGTNYHLSCLAQQPTIYHEEVQCPECPKYLSLRLPSYNGDFCTFCYNRDARRTENMVTTGTDGDVDVLYDDVNQKLAQFIIRKHTFSWENVLAAFSKALDLEAPNSKNFPKEHYTDRAVSQFRRAPIFPYL